MLKATKIENSFFIFNLYKKIEKKKKNENS